MWVGRVCSVDGGVLDESTDDDTDGRVVVTTASCPARTAVGRPSAMTTDAAPLGRCPECGRSVPSGWALIEYERANGEQGVFAECPSCESVIRPE